MAAFRATYPSGTKFKKIFQVVAKIFSELPFYITMDELKIMSMTEDKNIMAILSMPSETFEEYEVYEEVRFKVDGDSLLKIAKRGTKDDKVVLEYDKDREKMIIRFINKKTGVEREFDINAIATDVEELREPAVELKARMVMDPEDFKNIVRDVKIVTDEATFEVNNDVALIRAEEAEKEYEAELREGDPLRHLEAQEEVKVKYGIENLEAVARAYQAAKEMTLELGTNLPMRIHYFLETGAQLVFWVAPRV